MILEDFNNYKIINSNTNTTQAINGVYTKKEVDDFLSAIKIGFQKNKITAPVYWLIFSGNHFLMVIIEKSKSGVVYKLANLNDVNGNEPAIKPLSYDDIMLRILAGLSDNRYVGFTSSFYSNSVQDIETLKVVVENYEKNGYTTDDIKNRTDSFNTGSLYFAARSNDIELAKKLINNGEDVNLKNKPGDYTPLDISVDRGYVEMVELLLDNGASKDELSTQIGRAKLFDHKVVEMCLLKYKNTSGVTCPCDDLLKDYVKEKSKTWTINKSIYSGLFDSNIEHNKGIKLKQKEKTYHHKKHYLFCEDGYRKNKKLYVNKSPDSTSEDTEENEEQGNVFLENKRTMVALPRD